MACPYDDFFTPSEGGRQQTDKAEARRAASAQAAFPSRPARAKAVPEKDKGMMRTQARQQEKTADFNK
jgi:hypothetical protein